MLYASIASRVRFTTLPRPQVQVFYEAVGYMVSAQADAPTRDGLLMKMMENRKTSRFL